MTIPLTVVGPQSSTDLVLPARVPIAVLEPELGRLTGHPCPRLATAGGRVLDTSIGLYDNGVTAGAVLVATDREARAPVVDDVVTLATLEPDACDHPGQRGAALALAVAAVVGFAAFARSPQPLAIGCLVTVLGWTALPRLALRIFRVDSSSNPADPGMSERVRSARSLTAGLGRLLAAGTLGGSAALAMLPGLVYVAAGWLGLLAVVFRIADRDRVLTMAAVAAVSGVLVHSIQVDEIARLCVAAAGATIVASVLGGVRGRGARAPFIRVLGKTAQRVVSALLPTALLVAAGLAAGLGL